MNEHVILSQINDAVIFGIVHYHEKIAFKRHGSQSYAILVKNVLRIVVVEEDAFEPKGYQSSVIQHPRSRD
jgi:hypothetical protein